MSQKLCIFCNKSGLTKEHFWPDWLGKQIGKNEADKYVEGSIQAEPKSNNPKERFNTRSGNVFTKKFRVVCSDCNNGWMSRLEEQVKPILMNVIDPCDITLNQEEILLISKWIVMKTLLAEHTNLNTNSVPKEDLLIFGIDQKIPEYFRVYLAKHDTSESCAYSRTSARLGTQLSKKSHVGKDGNNTQATSFIVGKLFVYVFSCTDHTVNVLGDFKLNQMKRIKVGETTQINLKKLKVLNQLSIQNIVYALEDRINAR